MNETKRTQISLRLTELEIVEACSDTLSVWTTRLDMLSEQFADRDAFPLKVFR